jgi:hypothetical protein
VSNRRAVLVSPDGSISPARSDRIAALQRRGAVGHLILTHPSGEARVIHILGAPAMSEGEALAIVARNTNPAPAPA